MASLLGGRRVLVIPLDSSGTVTSAAPSMGLDGLIPPFHADAFRPKIQTSRARFPYGAIAITIIIVIVINRQENGELICLCRLMTFHDGRRCQSRQPTLCWPILFFLGGGGEVEKKTKNKTRKPKTRRRDVTESWKDLLRLPAHRGKRAG